MERVLIWSELLCSFSLTHVGVVLIDEKALYRSPQLGRDHIVIYMTKNYATKMEKGHSRYNGLFKIKVFPFREGSFERH